MREYYRVEDAPIANPFDPVGDGYGGEIDNSDIIFCDKCEKCHAACNPDESIGGRCVNCVESEGQ